MRYGSIFVAAIAGLAAIVIAARADTTDTHANDVCIMGTSVAGTTVLDNRTVLFRMNDGTVWRNTLRVECPNLKFEQGFAQVIIGNEICANKQVITVLRRGTPCQLGDFTREPRPKSQ